MGKKLKPREDSKVLLGFAEKVKIPPVRAEQTAQKKHKKDNTVARPVLKTTPLSKLIIPVSVCQADLGHRVILLTTTPILLSFFIW